MRDLYAAQSYAIWQNSAFTPADRKVQLTELAARATAELRGKLGQDATDAYLRQASWMHALQGGNAFTTDPRQLPPGSARPSAGSTWYPLPPRAVPPKN